MKFKNTTASQDIKHTIDKFKEIFNKFNSEKKLQIASLYQANQSLFNSIAMIKGPEPIGIMLQMEHRKIWYEKNKGITNFLNMTREN